MLGPILCSVFNGHDDGKKSTFSKLTDDTTFEGTVNMMESKTTLWWNHNIPEKWANGTFMKINKSKKKKQKQSCTRAWINPSNSSGWGWLSSKQLCINRPGRPIGQQAEQVSSVPWQWRRPTASWVVLGRMQAADNEPSPLFSIGESTFGVLCLVLGSPG